MRSSDIKIILVICSSSNFRLQNIEITPCLPHHLKCPMVSWGAGAGDSSCWKSFLAAGLMTEVSQVETLIPWTSLKLLETSEMVTGWADDDDDEMVVCDDDDDEMVVCDESCVWVVWVSPYSVLCTHSTHSTLTDYHSSGNCRPQHTLQHCRHTHVTHTAVTSHQHSSPGDISQDEPSTGEIIE